MYLQRTTREWDETVFGTRYDFFFTEDGYPSLRTWVSDLTISIVEPIFSHAQPLLLTAIAANRFTAFCLPLKHSSLWRARPTVVVVAVIAVMSTFLGVVCPVAILVRQAVLCSVANRRYKDDLYCDDEIWAFNLVCDDGACALTYLTKGKRAVTSRPYCYWVRFVLAQRRS